MSIVGIAKSESYLKGSIKAVPKIDKTLTKSGQAADAKCVGDELARLGEKLDALEKIAEQTAV